MTALGSSPSADVSIAGQTSSRRRSRILVLCSIAYREIRERLQFDWSASRMMLTHVLVLVSFVPRLLRRNGTELRVLGFIWRLLDSRLATEFTERRLHAIRRARGSVTVAAVYCGIVDDGANMGVEKILRESMFGPRPFEKRLLILKAPDANGKGVLVLKYTNYFKHFLRVFDVSAVAKDYSIVLEPSWIGFFLPDILAFETLSPDRVWVQTWEDRDRRLLDGMSSNLTTVPLSPNAWTNPRVFVPAAERDKRYDAILVSVWADYKRHFALFRALKAARNPELRIVCVGEPWPRTLDSIRAEARYYGVAHQVDFFDSLSHESLCGLYAASRIALLLSRKEGPNKAIVEAMFAGTPAFLRHGFNYGTAYPYINEHTGGFFDERELPRLLLDAHAGRFSTLRPDRWVRTHWNPVSSTRVLEMSLFGKETNSLHVKVNSPDLDYLDPSSWQVLEPAYRAFTRYLR